VRGGTHPGNERSDDCHHQRELQPCCPVPAWQMGTWTHLRCLGQLQTSHRCWPFRKCRHVWLCTTVFIMHQYQGLLAPKILHFCFGGRSCMSTHAGHLKHVVILHIVQGKASHIWPNLTGSEGSWNMCWPAAALQMCTSPCAGCAGQHQIREEYIPHLSAIHGH